MTGNCGLYRRQLFGASTALVSIGVGEDTRHDGLCLSLGCVTDCEYIFFADAAADTGANDSVEVYAEFFGEFAY